MAQFLRCWKHSSTRRHSSVRVSLSLSCLGCTNCTQVPLYHHYHCPRDRPLPPQLLGVLVTPGHPHHMQLYPSFITLGAIFFYLVCSYSKQAAKNTALLSSGYSTKQKLERICIYQYPENKGGGNFCLKKTGKFPPSLLSAPALSRH